MIKMFSKVFKNYIKNLFLNKKYLFIDFNYLRLEFKYNFIYFVNYYFCFMDTFVHLGVTKTLRSSKLKFLEKKK